MLASRRFRLAMLILLGGALLAAAAAYALIRWGQGNFHVVVAGQVYRSAQPSPEQLADWARKHGIRAILNLRDDEEPQASDAASAPDGVRLIHVPLSDRALPRRQDLLGLIEALEAAPRPLLIHCLAGADRTGVASVIAAMAIGGLSYEQARSQLSLRYLHLGDDPGAIEGVLLKYERYCRQHRSGTGGWQEFRLWAIDHYSPTYHLVAIQAPDTIRATVGEPVEVPLVIQNRSDLPIPAGEPGRIFKVAAYAGSAVDMLPDREFGRRTQLPETIPPGGSLPIVHVIRPPATGGSYEIFFGLVEEHVTWFATEGSPERARVLIVQPR
jgi:protein tyrosine/serine phosphatase